MPFMEDLYEATHENVQLAVLDRGEALYIDRIAGRRSVHVITRAGTRLPLHATGVGLVLLAHAPHDEREATCSPRRWPRYTPHTITEPRRLRRVLADVRRDGYAISDRQIETISMSVAAPIRDPHGEVRGGAVDRGRSRWPAGPQARTDRRAGRPRDLTRAQRRLDRCTRKSAPAP